MSSHDSPNGSSKSSTWRNTPSYPSCPGPTKSNAHYSDVAASPVLENKLSPRHHNLTSRHEATNPYPVQESRTHRPQPITTQRSTLAIRDERPKPLLTVRSARKKHTRSRSGPPTPREPDIPRGCRPINRRQRPGLLIFFSGLLFLARRLPRFEACEEGRSSAERYVREPLSSSPPPRRFPIREGRRCRGSRGCADFVLSRFRGSLVGDPVG